MAKKIFKWIGALLLLILVNLILLFFIGYIRLAYKAGFSPAFLVPALLAGWWNRLPLTWGTVRWFLSSIAAAGLIKMFLAGIGSELVVFFYAEITGAFVWYIIISILVFLLGTWLYTYVKENKEEKAGLKWAFPGLIVILIFLSWPLGRVSSLPGDAKKFLKAHANAVDISDNNDYSSFSLLEPGINDCDVFLFGQEYGIKKDFDIKLKLLKYLNRKRGVRYYLFRGGYGESCVLNRFLETGADEYLKNLFTCIKSCGSRVSRDYFEYPRKIREYNLTLPEDRRITFVGIDVAYDFRTEFYALYVLLSETTPGSQRLSPYIKKIKDLYLNWEQKKKNKLLKKECKNMVEELAGLLKTHELELEVYLGKKFFDLEMILKNIKRRMDFTKSKRTIKDYTNRIEHTYDNFREIYRHLPYEVTRKFFGYGAHLFVQQRDSKHFKRLGAILQHLENSPVKGKVLSILSVYHNCFEPDTETGKPVPLKDLSGTRHFLFLDDVYDLVSLAGGEVTLFRLTGDQSPFREKLLLKRLLSTPVDQPGVTTDYFQFLVLVQNSDAITFYQPETEKNKETP